MELCECAGGVTRAAASRSEESSRSVTASVIITDIITEFHQQPFSWNARITVHQCSLDWILTGKQSVDRNLLSLQLLALENLSSISKTNEISK